MSVNSVNGDVRKSDSNISIIGEKYDQEVRPLINIIDQLRACGVDEFISLPTVAVVGSQSSGKSSVLEAISGIPLPRGENIVTRCPLEMRMERADLTESPWYIEISYNDSGKNITKKLERPEDVTAEIDSIQAKIAGPGTNVSDQLISLFVRSHNAPNLTLIDLPGIVHARREDQERNIIEKVETLVRGYMEKDNTIMLTVLPANADLATNKVLDMAHTVDPRTVRTIAVVTKPDLVSDPDTQETLCKNIQNGSAFKLRDIFLVKSRSVRELREKTPLHTVFTSEEQYFRSHPVYNRMLRPNILGFKNLTNCLTQRLVKAIKDFLPTLRTTISRQIREANNALAQMPPPPPTERSAKISLLYSKINGFTKDVENSLSKGDAPATWHAEERAQRNSNENGKLNHATMFSYWRKQFAWFMNELLLHTKGKFSSRGDWSEENLAHYLQTQRGEELPFFPNYGAYKRLCSEHLEFYRPIADELLDKLMMDMKEFIDEYVKKNFNSNIELMDEIKDICYKESDQALEEARKRLDFIFETEQLIFTQDETFTRQITLKEQLESAKQQVIDRQSSSQNHVPQAADAVRRVLSMNPEDYKSAAKDVRKHLETYFEVTNQRIGDSIPAALRSCLHIRFAKSLSETLNVKITDDDLLDALTENDSFAGERKELNRKIQSLQDGKQKLKGANIQ